MPHNVNRKLVDVALHNMLLGTRGIDFGRVLKNVVFLELMRRYPNVYIGKVDNMEVDFITTNGQEVCYFQVCASMRDDSTREHELKPLQSIGDNFPKTILTLDPDPLTYHNGIKQQNAIEWLMEKI